MAVTPDELVRREVAYCCSTLVAMLASADYHADDSQALEEAKDQAMNLAAPIDDWEEPLFEAGWKRVDIGDGQNADWRWQHPEDLGPGEPDARTACEEAKLEPHQREVFEHWIVGDWLADKLTEVGEKVDKDFAGLTIWARTTSGQAIAADSVIERICADLNKGV